MKLLVLTLVTLVSVSASAQFDRGDLRDGRGGGYDRDGRDRDGRDRDGRDRDGYDRDGRDRHGRGRHDRGVQCRITTTNYNIYEARGRTCRDAQENVIAECVIGQKRRGVSNWDRCEHSIRPGRKYTMRCTDGCGY